MVTTVEAGSVVPGCVVVSNSVLSSVVVKVSASNDDMEIESAVWVMKAVVIAVAVSYTNDGWSKVVVMLAVEVMVAVR